MGIPENPRLPGASSWRENCWTGASCVRLKIHRGSLSCLPASEHHLRGPSTRYIKCWSGWLNQLSQVRCVVAVAPPCLENQRDPSSWRNSDLPRFVLSVECFFFPWKNLPAIFSLRSLLLFCPKLKTANMREIVHLQAGQCGNQIGAKVSDL